jgi:hypothetical protein
MAVLNKRGSHLWVNHRVNSCQPLLSQDAANKRGGKARLMQQENELTIRELEAASAIPVTTIVTDFCEHLKMGDSPAICQRHYAALIPETMHDTVEFPTGNPKTAVAPSSANDIVAKELLERLLRELQARQGLQKQRRTT